MPKITEQTLYDVVIVGSGAGGGMAAYMLAKAGAKVALLEAGPLWWPEKDSAMFKWNYESPRRGAGTRLRPFGEFDAGDGGWDIDGEPYTRAPGTEFEWYRGRMLGGRTNHWGRISLRLGPDDFRRKSLDGLGDDWPIGYDDIKPYYDRVDQLVGIFGSVENIPNEPDGIFMPPPAPRCWEHLVKGAADKLKKTCIPSRLSIITKPLGDRAACHYCAECYRGCTMNSNFSSPGVLLKPALATGRLTILPNSMAREVTIDSAGRAKGVAYVDKATGKDREVHARVIVLAASALESARLLLNSKSRSKDGLSNSSGVVGRYITDSVGSSMSAFVPKLMDLPAHNCDGAGGGHLYFPWVLDNRALDFPRGYHIEIYGGRQMPGLGTGRGIQNRPIGGGYGKAFKEANRSYFGAVVNFAGRGEMVPNANSFCEIDPVVKDRWGIPVLRFHWKWSDYEILQAKHMQQTFAQIFDAMGATPLRKSGPDINWGIEAGGKIIHEVGGTRMGNDPKTSVVNRNCQSHEVKNLFIADGGPFVSQPHKNPTWTILALAMRTSDHIAQLMKEGGL